MAHNHQTFHETFRDTFDCIAVGAPNLSLHTLIHTRIHTQRPTTTKIIICWRHTLVSTARRRRRRRGSNNAMNTNTALRFRTVPVHYKVAHKTRRDWCALLGFHYCFQSGALAIVHLYIYIFVSP